MPLTGVGVRATRSAARGDVGNERHAGWLQRLFRLRAEDTLPLAIEHQRIYILPTGRGWAFLAALLLMLVASINYALSLGYALCFLLTGLFAASLLHTYRNLAGVKVQALASGDAFAGEPVDVHVTLHDPSRRAREAIAIGDRQGHSRAVTGIAANATVRATLALPTERRGYHPVGRLTLSSDWPLGLWRTWSYLHAPARALIWPAPEPAPPALPQRPGDEGAGRATPDRDGDVAGLRAWTPGDPPSRIAWKRAASGGALQVRLLDAPAGPARIELTLERAGMQALEARLARLTAWALAADAAGADYALRLPGAAPIEAGHGTAHRRRVLDALASWRPPAPG